MIALAAEATGADVAAEFKHQAQISLHLGYSSAHLPVLHINVWDALLKGYFCLIDDFPPFPINILRAQVAPYHSNLSIFDSQP